MMRRYDHVAARDRATAVTGEQLRAHVLELAAGLGVRVRVHPALDPDVENGFGPRAYPVQRVVDTLPITDARSYAIGLHELGHLATPPGSTFLIGEARATVWALDQAIVPLDLVLLREAWLSHVDPADGGWLTFGSGLVADGELPEYVAAWLRLVAPA
jgi:hypothetical protein